MSESVKLYEIVQVMTDAIEQYNTVESDEQLLVLEKKLDEIQLQFNDKAVAVVQYMSTCEGHIIAIDQQLKRLNALKTRYSCEQEWLKKYLKRSMEQVNSTKIESPYFKIAIVQNNPSVEVLDESLIPEEYKRIIPETKEVDKRKILDVHKQGIGVEGTKVIRNTRLKIS